MNVRNKDFIVCSMQACSAYDNLINFKILNKHQASCVIIFKWPFFFTGVAHNSLSEDLELCKYIQQGTFACFFSCTPRTLAVARVFCGRHVKTKKITCDPIKILTFYMSSTKYPCDHQSPKRRKSHASHGSDFTEMMKKVKTAYGFQPHIL